MSTRKYTSRPYDEARDRAEYKRWSAAHKVVDMPAGLLPPSGAVVEDESGNPCAMGWVYFDQRAGFAFAACPTANPDLPAFAVCRALEALIASIATIASGMGAKLLYATAPANMQPMLERCHFIANHPVVGFWRPLDGLAAVIN